MPMELWRTENSIRQWAVLAAVTYPDIEESWKTEKSGGRIVEGGEWRDLENHYSKITIMSLVIFLQIYSYATDHFYSLFLGIKTHFCYFLFLDLKKNICFFFYF